MCNNRWDAGVYGQVKDPYTHLATKMQFATINGICISMR